MNSICVIIPVTSRNREWKSFKETDLYNIFFKSFLLTYNKELPHLFCFAIDPDDKLFNDIKDDITRLVNVMKNCSVHFISTCGIKKGHVGEMWNKCFEYGIQENYDYFLQSGDDIEFYNADWENYFIEFLKEKNNIGVCGFSDMGRLYFDKEDRLLTQSFVHRTHWDIFGYYYPKEIANWGIDDWLTEVYGNFNLSLYSTKHSIANKGGEPRYNIVNERKLWNKLIVDDIHKLKQFLKK
tara:strand:- start:145 stop:861 length:717 start_codon:yes stop_codon:yes gene_type:complete